MKNLHNQNDPHTVPKKGPSTQLQRYTLTMEPWFLQHRRPSHLILGSLWSLGIDHGSRSLVKVSEVIPKKIIATIRGHLHSPTCGLKYSPLPAKQLPKALQGPRRRSPRMESSIRDLGLLGAE